MGDMPTGELPEKFMDLIQTHLDDLPEPVPSVKVTVGTTKVREVSPPVDGDDDYHGLISEPLEKQGICRQTSLMDCANSLLRSHIWGATQASWALKENLIIWFSGAYNQVKDHPEMTRVKANRIGIEEALERRPYDLMELGGFKYAIAPAFNALRLQAHPYWSEIGLKYKVGNLPGLPGRYKWLEVDPRETLLPTNNIAMLYLIDRSFKRTVAPAVNQRLRNAIFHVFGLAEVGKIFPDLAATDHDLGANVTDQLKEQIKATTKPEAETPANSPKE